jgi:hypothetical protein
MARKYQAPAIGKAFQILQLISKENHGLARVSHRSSWRDGGDSHGYKARAGKCAQAYFYSTSRSFFKRNAVDMGLLAVAADYW